MQPAAASDVEYYKRLGLERDPFVADAMPDFFFVGAQRRFLVQRAVHALYFSGATVLLLGADGAGKTRTLVEIEKELKDIADICHIDATVLMDAAEIRALLAGALGLPGAVAAGNVELVHALERVRPRQGDPQPVLIAIDAAQLLSIETLAECAALVAGAGGRLRLLLAGEFDLATAWQQAQAGVTEMLELKPLDRSETEDYVRTKLQAAGYREAQLPSAAKFDHLFAQSGGNFATIDTLAESLLQPAVEAVPVVQRIKVLPLLPIGGAVVLLTIVMVFMLYRGGSQSSQEVHSPQVIAQQASPSTHSGERKTIALQLPTSSAPAAVPNATPVARVEPRVATPPVEIPENKNTVPASAVVAEIKLPTEKKPAATPLPIAPIVEKTAVVAPSAKPALVSGSTEKPNATAAPNAAPSSFNEDERALLALPASSYVLQLVGGGSEAAIEKFISGAGKELKLYRYHTLARGKPWFVVVAGPYADRNEAQAAIATLPETVRQLKPWPRALASVQTDINANGGR